MLAEDCVIAAALPSRQSVDEASELRAMSRPEIARFTEAT